VEVTGGDWEYTAMLQSFRFHPMKIVYSDFHINHSPKLYFAMGKMSEYPEKISRMQSILDALQHIPHELKNPVDHDMAPILAVHSKQYVEYLQTAYETWIENHGDPNGVIPDTFACRIDQIYNDIGLKSSNVFSKHGMFLFDTAGENVSSRL
jgi:acetoin utilization deacetylase AcuC-like enzyme